MACADAIKRLCTCFHRTTTATTAKPRQKTKSFPATQETQTYHESRRCCRGTPAAGSRRERKETGRTWAHIGVWFMTLACRTRHSPVATPQIRQNPCGLTAQSSAHGKSNAAHHAPRIYNSPCNLPCIEGSAGAG